MVLIESAQFWRKSRSINNPKPNLKMKKNLLIILIVLHAFTAFPQWTVENLSVGRYQLAAAATGNIAMFGGGLLNTNFTLASRTDVIDVYNATTNTWSTSQLSLARTNLYAASAGTKILFAGGDTALSPFYQTRRVEIYDVMAGTWSMAQLSLARTQMTIVNAGTKCFFAGGVYGTSNIRTDTVDIYDAATNTWSVTRLPTARNIAGGAYCNGKVYIAGGQGAGTGGVVGTVDIYNIASGTWSSIPFPNPRRWLTGGSLGDLIFFAGGDVTQSNADYIDIYNTITGQWSVKTMSIAKQYIEIASLGNKIYFAGGVDAGFIPKSTMDIYNITTNTWTMHNLSVARSRHGAVNVDNRVMFGGGSPIVQGGLPQISVDVFTDATVGVNEYEISDLAVEISPNPANNEFMISGLPLPVEVKMVNAYGQEVMSQQIKTANSKLQTLNLPPGIYFIELLSENKKETRKLIIQH